MKKLDTNIPEEFHGKVIRLPNRTILELMDKKYSVCPFCGETRRIGNAAFYIYNHEGVNKSHSISWYGHRKDNFLSKFKFWERKCHWRIDYWSCNTCGAEWKSEPYPN